jgi:hypothetical protein
MKITKEVSEHYSRIGRVGGKRSVKYRFAGKSKDEISEIMRRVSACRKKITK